VLYPGFDELDAIGPYETLKMASGRGGMDVQLVLAGPAADITASHGTVIRASASIEDGWDIVIVPGGGWARREGAFVQAERGELPATLARLHAQGTTLASVCTGAMLLAAAGLLRNRPATTHPVALDDLRAAGAEIVDARVVDDGDIITCGGITSGIDLGLWLVERLASRAAAERIATRLQYRRVDEVHRGPRFPHPVGT
jgi:transcriptional regulator GlxA family with amidase domain